ncbi:MAG TPA: glycoside hydrolase 100 family protein [Rubrobacteraceae bacterium]|nr:glycoside hydrolase 100 family protein [Rubrobacteraceae bacterium]
MSGEDPPRSFADSGRGLAHEAKEVLRNNDMGGWTKAAPNLYPHQWSWDSALIAIGLARLDPRRAARELETLFDRQWKTGKVPHIVFNEDAPADSYFPGADHWYCTADSPDAPPASPYTSCLVQPPVHAIAARHIWEVAREENGGSTNESRAFLGRIYPKLLGWHRYLLTYRDREEMGLVTIYHPWESGMDNSPRWDGALGRVEVGDMPDFERRDLQHVDDPSERPTDFEYKRYIWLVESMKRAVCDEDAIYEAQQFQVKDVLASGILVAANEALLEIAEILEAPDEDRELMRAWTHRGREGLERCWHEDLGLYLDYDVLAGELLQARTVAGFLAPLVAGGLEPARLKALVTRLQSAEFLGHPDLYRPLPPSTSPDDPGFMRRSYWRGPFWPVITWLLWWSLERAGEKELADRLRQTALAQISEHGFGEYFDPFTGESLGAEDQSWTAAVALEWLAEEPYPEQKAS